MGQRLEVVHDRAHLLYTADQQVPLGLGHQQVGGAPHPEFLGLDAQLFFLPFAGGRSGRYLLPGAVDFQMGVADVQFDQLVHVVQGLFSLLAPQLCTPVAGPGPPIGQGVLQAETHPGVVTASVKVADGAAKGIGITAFAQVDEQLQARQQPVFGADHLQFTPADLQFGLVDLRPLAQPPRDVVLDGIEHDDRHSRRVRQGDFAVP